MEALSTAPKPFVFVLMPFSTEFDDIYQLGIKAACTECGAHCERVDEQIFDGSILERVYNQISKADLLVADLTGKNPNVFYETGYAHALGKRVVLLTQRAEDIPFDMRHYSHLIYGGRISELRKQLVRRVSFLLATPQATLASSVSAAEFFHHGSPLEGQEIEIEVSPSDTTIDFNIDVYNPSSQILGPSRLALISTVGLGFRRGGSGARIQLPDGRYLHDLRDVPRLYPEAWGAIECNFQRERMGFRKGRFGDEGIYYAGPIRVCLRIYQQTGPRDISFVISVVHRADSSTVSEPEE